MFLSPGTKGGGRRKDQILEVIGESHREKAGDQKSGPLAERHSQTQTSLQRGSWGNEYPDARVQPQWIQGIRSGDGVGEDQETTA